MQAFSPREGAAPASLVDLTPEREPRAPPVAPGFLFALRVSRGLGRCQTPPTRILTLGCLTPNVTIQLIGSETTSDAMARSLHFDAGSSSAIANCSSGPKMMRARVVLDDVMPFVGFGRPPLRRLFIAAQKAVALLPAMRVRGGRRRYNSLTSGLQRLKRLDCTENAGTAQQTSFAALQIA